MELKKTTVLIVDDSPLIRSFLVNILRQDPQFAEIHTATNGQEAIEMVKRKRPDVITMDIHMPGIDGFETTRQIMQAYPVPVVIVSGFYNPSEIADAFKAIEAGAVTIMARPDGPESRDFKKSSYKFIQTIKLMSEVKVVRRYSKPSINKIVPAASVSSFHESLKSSSIRKQIIVIGASAGGPQVLQKILKELPDHFPLPILLVQHIDSGFAQGFATWLQDAIGKKVTLATHHTEPLPGGIYLPPGDCHMGITTDGKIMLTQEAAENGLRPSVSYLFRSAHRVYGNRVVAILLSGMGKDGALEMKMLKDSGSITIAQDAESSMIHGMPGEAIRLGGVNMVLSPEQIIAFLTNNLY